MIAKGLTKAEQERLESYAREGSTERKIIERHFQGMAPSEIDKELKLKPGTAHNEVVMYWDYQKEKK